MTATRFPAAPIGTQVRTSGPSRDQLIRWARAGYLAALRKDAPRVAAICAALLREYGEPLPQRPPAPPSEWEQEATRRESKPALAALVARTATPDDVTELEWQDAPTAIRKPEVR